MLAKSIVYACAAMVVVAHCFRVVTPAFLPPLVVLGMAKWMGVL